MIWSPVMETLLCRKQKTLMAVASGFDMQTTLQTDLKRASQSKQ
jgi:hypothetical protein